MPRVEVTRAVRAPADTVYRICRDPAAFPRFMPNVVSVTVREAGEGWAVTEWVTRLQGRTFRWTERDEYDDAARRIAYRQLSGDLKQFEGEWRIVPEGATTRVTFVCEFEFGIPVIAALLNPVAALALRSNAEDMLAAIEREAAAPGSQDPQDPGAGR